MSSSEDTAARKAHDWYVAEPTRSIEEAGLEFGYSAQQLRKMWGALGLASKGVHVAKRGKAHKNRTDRDEPSAPESPRGRVARPNVQRIQRRWGR